jgi:hypothetical protein
MINHAGAKHCQTSMTSKTDNEHTGHKVSTGGVGEGPLKPTNAKCRTRAPKKGSPLQSLCRGHLSPRLKGTSAREGDFPGNAPSPGRVHLPRPRGPGRPQPGLVYDSVLAWPQQSCTPAHPHPQPVPSPEPAGSPNCAPC